MRRNRPARGSEEWWQEYLLQGHRLEGVARFLFPRLPSQPRCKICSAPFGGFGRVLRYFGWAPSRKNPRLCGFCSDRLPAGGANVPVAILVVDVRGYTSMSEKLSGQELALKMNTFFEEATEIMMRFDALIDKYVGDAVQALWLQGVAGGEYIQNAVSAADALASHFRGKLSVGVAVHYGEAFVGNVGAVGMIDLTAMGDVVNTTHRLQGHATEGQVIVSEAVYEVMGRPDGWVSRSLDLKGKAEPMEAWLKEHPVSSELHER